MKTEEQVDHEIAVARSDYERSRATVMTGMHWAYAKVIELMSRVLAETRADELDSHVRELSRWAQVYLRAKASAVRVLMMQPASLVLSPSRVPGEGEALTPLCVDGVDGFVVDTWSSRGREGRTTIRLTNRDGLEIRLVVVPERLEALEDTLRRADAYAGKR
jgi:hypothetical protein